MLVTNGAPRLLEIDPVCGRELMREQAPLRTELRGREYVFCSERCRLLFTIRPAWFVDHASGRTKKASWP